MGETPEQQRERHQRKRLERNPKLIQCLECDLSFVRVGSHVVQVHGYESAWEYRRKYGLIKKETVLQEHAEEMREKAKNHENLKSGRDQRFKPGNDSAKQFWDRRLKQKKGKK